MGGRVVILGPGLLGASLALALAQQQRPSVVWGRRREPLDYLAPRCPLAETQPDLAKALQDAEFVILATPIGIMPTLLEQIAQFGNLAPSAIITDVGSVKGPIVEQATALLEKTGYRFVGSHPMAGSEASGVEAAQADLFEQAMCLVTPTAETDTEASETTCDFWGSLKGRVHQIHPSEHDQIVAHVSHMPHALASLVVTSALRGHPEWAQFSGGGLHDTTRIASGLPAMWTEILSENQAAVVEALKGAQSHLQNLIESIESGESEAVHRFLLEAKELRDTHIVPHR